LAKDEALLLDFINTNTLNLKFIIAPHNIKKNQIEQFKTTSQKSSLILRKQENLADFDVFIIDTIGILTKIVADIAFVGGGFGNPGVHNLLEPATFGVP
jgi:3-deoxy-D-manno-octulosonic-acid transferase